MSYVGDPGKFAAAITPHDSTNLTAVTRAIYVGSAAGNITAIINGSPVLFVAVPIGILPIQCSRVNATGTTSTNLVALW
jgi:hypothetical protein